jgi:hypothetical protein
MRTESVQRVFVQIVGRPHRLAYASQAPTVTAWAATQGVDLRETFDEIAGSANPPGISSAWPSGFEQRPASSFQESDVWVPAAEPIDLRTESPEPERAKEPAIFAEQIGILQQTIQQQGDIIARQDATLQNYQQVITDQAAVIDRQAQQLQRNEDLIVRMDERLTAQDELLTRALEAKNAPVQPSQPAAATRSASSSASTSSSRAGRHARPDAGNEEELPNLPLTEAESQRTVAVNARAQRTLAAIRARKAVSAPHQRMATDAQLAQRRVVARHPVQHP